MKSKKLYVFGPLSDSWKSWFFYGTEAECRKWLLKENVEEKDLDDWISKAHVFNKEETIQ